ncbi:hypothetical protein JCM3770_004538, partial [Rhodotorula araucariae]
MALLRPPLRTLRAPLKLLFCALALAAVYRLAALLPSSASAAASSSGTYPTPDPRLKRGTQDQFDFETEKRRWSEALRVRPGGDVDAGAGEQHWAAQAANEGGPREWAQQGRAPPR